MQRKIIEDHAESFIVQKVNFFKRGVRVSNIQQNFSEGASKYFGGYKEKFCCTEVDALQHPHFVGSDLLH